MVDVIHTLVRQPPDEREQTVYRNRWPTPLGTMLQAAPTAARREALLEHVAAWPEWEAGRPPWLVRFDLSFARAMRGRVPTPAWVADRPWLTEELDAARRALLDVAPYAPQGMAADAARLLSTEAAFAQLPCEVLASYLSPPELRTALEARWDALPRQRPETFLLAKRDAPALALQWLCMEPLAPEIQEALRGRLGEWAPATFWRGYVSHQQVRVADRRALLIAGLIERTDPAQVTVPRGAARELVRVLEDATLPYHHLLCARALERVSGRKYGWDVDAWRRWLVLQPEGQVQS